MSTTARVVELAETCRCGASTSVKAAPLTARRHVEQWRSVHRCDPADEHNRGRTGAGTTFPGSGRVQRVGFGSAPEVLAERRWYQRHEQRQRERLVEQQADDVP